MKTTPHPTADELADDNNQHGSRGYDKDFDGAYADDGVEDDESAAPLSNYQITSLPN